MAKYTTTASVVLNLNGKQAKQILQSLEKQATNLRVKIDSVKKAQVLDKGKLKALTRELNSVERNIEQMRSGAIKATQVMQRLDKASPKELNTAIRQLTKELNGIERGSAAWNAHVQKIQAMKQQLNAINAQMALQKSGWQKFTAFVNNSFSSIMSAITTFTTLLLTARKAVNTYAEMEESLANTVKYTRMTADEVDKLNDAFKKMDTRLSREQLNLLAQEAGRLGKNTVESVKQYVEAASIINVALVDLGEGATQTIAKISNIFGIEDMYGVKDAMLKVGSTVNHLSQNCTAAKPFLVEFAQRMAGIGATAKMTVPDILAFAATLDAHGQKVEMSASAISRLVMILFKDPLKVAGKVGLEAKKFANTLQNDTTQAIIMFLEKLNELGEARSLAVLSPLFKDLGMDGVRMAQVLSNLSSHLEFLKWEMGEANQAFKDGTSATNEYNIFNNTAMAAIDKAKNKLHEMVVELGEKLYPLMSHVYSSSSALLRVMYQVVKWFDEYKKVLGPTLSILAIYYTTLGAVKVAKLAWLAVTSAGTTIMTTFKGVLGGLKIVLLAVTLQFGKAKEATKALNATMKATPWGQIIAAVATLAITIYNLCTRTTQYEESLKDARKRIDEFNSETLKEKKELDKLFGALQSVNSESEEYKSAKDKIISQYGAYLRGLINEKGEILDLEKAYQRLTAAINLNARAKNIQSAADSEEKGYLEEAQGYLSEIREELEKVKGYGKENEAIIQGVAGIISKGDVDLNSHSAMPESWYKAFSKRFGLYAGIGTATPAEILKLLGGGWWNSPGRKLVKLIGEHQKNSEDYKTMLRSVRPEWNASNEELWQIAETIDRYLAGEISLNTIKFYDDKGNVATRMVVDHDNKNAGIAQLANSKNGGQTNGFVENYQSGVEKQTDELIAEWGRSLAPTGPQQPGSEQPKPEVRLWEEQSSRIPQQQGQLVLANPLTRGYDGITRYELEEYRDKIYTFAGNRVNATHTSKATPQEYVEYEKYETDADARAAEQAAKRAAVKARADFKAALDVPKAKWESADAENTASYRQGLITYSEYLRKKNELELQYYEEREKVYENFNLQEDEDYQELLKKHEAKKLAWQEKSAALDKHELERKQAEEVNVANKQYNDPSNATAYQNEALLQQRLLEIKIKYLEEEQKLYEKGSEQWQKLQEQIEDANLTNQLEMQKQYSAKVKEWSVYYARLSAEEKFKLEEAYIKRLLQDGLITQKTYDRILKSLKNTRENAGLPESAQKPDPASRDDKNSRREKMAEDIADIEALAARETWSEEKKQQAILRIKRYYAKLGMEAAKAANNEIVNNMLTLAGALQKMFNDSQEQGKDWAENLSSMISAAVALVMPILQAVTDYKNAALDLEIGKLEDRYEKEIELAEGNAYRTKKLEKEQEEEIARLKAEQSRKTFALQVLSAVAQTAENAISAYGAALKIGPAGLVLAPIAAAAAIAAGTLQVMTIKKQQEAAEAGYSEGGFTPDGDKKKPVGVVHAGEWVASQKLTKNPTTRPLLEALEMAQRTNTVGSLTAATVSRSITAPMVAARRRPVEVVTNSQDSAPSAESSRQMVQLDETINLLRQRLNEPFMTVNSITGDNGIQAAQEEYKRLIRNKSPKY